MATPSNSGETKQVNKWINRVALCALTCLGLSAAIGEAHAAVSDETKYIFNTFIFLFSGS